MADDENATWVKVQHKTFTRWVNTYLSERMMKVENLKTDFHDGLALIALLEVISSKIFAPKHNKQPKIKMQKLENINFCLDFLKTEGIKLVNIDSANISDGNLKLILGLIWTIILRYQIQVSEGNSAKRELLEWVRSMIPEYDINNFTNDWTSGKAICALAEAVLPGQMKLPQDFKNDPLADATMGIQHAHKNMNIPEILDAADMVNNPDELSNMTYISYFRDYLELERKRREQELFERTPVAGQCIAFGPGLQPGNKALEETHFTIESRNGAGRKCPVGGHKFDVTIHGPNGDVPANITDNGDGTYTAKYNPNGPGSYVIDVKFKTDHIKDSPFSVQIDDSLPWPETTTMGNFAFHFQVQVRDKGNNNKTHGGADIKASVSGGGNAQVQDNGNGTYDVSGTFPQRGNYQVAVTLNGHPIKGSPLQQSVN